MEKNKVVSGLLYLLSSICLGVGIFLLSENSYATWMFATNENAKIFFYFQHDMVQLFIRMVILMGILHLINAIGIFMLLKQKKIGLWIVSISSCVNLIINIILLYNGGFTSFGIIFCISSILLPILLVLIQGRKKY